MEAKTLYVILYILKDKITGQTNINSFGPELISLIKIKAHSSLLASVCILYHT